MDEYEAIGYWDGSTMQWINEFCSNIGGPSKSCGTNIIHSNNCGDSTVPKYDSYWIDKDSTGCPVVVIEIIPSPGMFVRKSDPGTPTCD